MSVKNNTVYYYFSIMFVLSIFLFALISEENTREKEIEKIKLNNLNLTYSLVSDFRVLYSANLERMDILAKFGNTEESIFALYNYYGESYKNSANGFIDVYNERAREIDEKVLAREKMPKFLTKIED